MTNKTKSPTVPALGGEQSLNRYLAEIKKFPVLTAEQEQSGNDAVVEFSAYLKDLIADRRKRPGDAATDVLTRLITDDADGELSEAELIQNCIFILNAGHETTTNLIGNGLHCLLEWPEEKQRLLDDPSLIDTAVEEFLRFESSNQLGNRRSTVETTFGDHVLPAGSFIVYKNIPC